MKTFKPAVINQNDVDSGILACPHCGADESGTLHQIEATVYFRNEDDHNGVTVRATSALDGYIGTDQTGNPSARRDGISVLFSCEQCTATSKLNIVQHKGDTYLNMEVVSVAPDLDNKVIKGKVFLPEVDPTEIF